MTKKFLFLFCSLIFFLSTFYLDTWQNGSSTSRAIAVVSFAESRTFQVDKYHERSVDKIFVNGHYYSDKAPLTIFLVIPFFEIANLIGIEPQTMERAALLIGDVLCGSIPFTLIVLITFLFIRKETNSLISPVLLATLPFFASFIFIYSGTYYGHLISALFLLLAYIFIRAREKFLLAGFLCGLSFISEFPTALVSAIWALQIFVNEKSFRSLLKFSLGILPSIIIIFIYNYVITGDFLNLSYKYHSDQRHDSLYGFSLPKFDALWGLILGLKRGILIYTSFLIIFLYELLKHLSSKRFSTIVRTFFTNYLSLISIASVLLISSFFEWTGGWCYGPRLIFFVAVLLCFEGILFLAKRNFYLPMFVILIIAGTIMTFAAKSTIVYSVPIEVENPFKDLVLKNFSDGNFNPNNILTMFFDVHPETANYIFFGLFASIIMLLTYLFDKEKKSANAI